VFCLDFREAFDKISHEYLFAILGKYAISKGVIAGYKSTGTCPGQYTLNVR
jgi:hypothetical protein